MMRLVFCLLLWLVPLRIGAQTLADPIGESFVMAQAGFASSAGNALRQIGLRAAAQDPAQAAAVRERQNLIENLAHAEARLADTLAQGTVPPALLTEVADLKARIERLEQGISAGFSGFDALASPRPLDIAAVRALLEPDEALLFVMSAKDTSFVWFITPGFAAWYRFSNGRAELADVVRDIRLGLGGAAPQRSATALDDSFGSALPSFPLDLAQALYRLLIRPVEEPMVDVRHLFVVTDGPLTALPFQLLVDAPEDLTPSNDPDVLRQTNWLIRKVALTTLPSVESLAALRGANRAPGAPGTGQLFAMGAPDLGVASGPAALTRGGLANVDAVRALPPLPGTVRELREIASAFATGHADLRMGAAATETALKSADRSGALAAADVVVFATHGLVSGELGLSEPALVLTPPATSSSEDDGLLTASEISTLDLHANWVVLSACNTASGDGQPDADGLSGLARAFLLAGARAMLVSHWPVRDDAAARLTTGAFREMANAPTPIRKAEAMRRSMIALMEDTRDPTLAHPFAWAPFVVVGEGGY